MPNTEASAESSETLDSCLDAQAEQLRQHAPAVAVCSSLTKLFGTRPNPRAYVRLVEQELELAGAPRDPIERTLVEQMVMAHSAISRLYVDSGSAQQADERCMLLATAARLTGECRRLALALQAYRADASSRLRVTTPETPIRKAV